jgi:hypothetical protein
MSKMRWLTIFTLLVLLFPSQAALAGRSRVKLAPSVSLTPFSVTTPRNSTVTYQVKINNLPNGGMHCVKVDVFVPNHYKIYPGAGYSFYHLYAPTTLDFKVKVPNTTQRKFFNARVSWSKDYSCRSIRITNYSSRVEIIVSQ